MKIRAAIIGPGNIGTDLLYKLERSAVLDPVWMVGVDPTSEGLSRARQMGLETTAEGVKGLLPHLGSDNIKVAFDATSAYAHRETSDLLTSAGVLVIDLTPAAIGPFCIPAVNLSAYVGKSIRNVNMVTCGGQATVPIVAAISSVQPVAFGEIVATVASKSAGPGTRRNIDEFTRTTATAIERFGGAKEGKAIIIETTIARDVLLQSRVDKPAMLRRLFELGCRYSGQVLSYTKMLGQLQDAGNSTTLAHYLDLLGGVGMVCGLQKYAGEVVRQRGSSPKLQVFNTALMTAQSSYGLREAKTDREYWGRLVESAVGAHLANAAAAGECEVFYWRGRSVEVDFIVRCGHTLTALEVKSGRASAARSGLQVFSELFKPQRKLLVGADGIALESFLSRPERLSDLTITRRLAAASQSCLTSQCRQRHPYRDLSAIAGSSVHVENPANRFRPLSHTQYPTATFPVCRRTLAIEAHPLI
jgi:acetaldehyde dehydrogenase (acetylating)